MEGASATMKTVSPFPSLGQISFTKFTSPEDVTAVLGAVIPGQTTASEISDALGRAGQPDPLWNDLLAYQPPVVGPNDAAGQRVAVDNELLRASRYERPDRFLLLWVALNLADPRLDDIVQTILTDDVGHLRFDAINGPVLTAALINRHAATGDTPHDGKTSSNILSLLERCRLITPTKHGKTIVGVEFALPTRSAVPGAVRLISERLADRGFTPSAGQEVHLALSIGAHAWLNLSPTEFTDAYYHAEAQEPRAQSVTTDPPDDLLELRTQLRRKGQVVLQGAPGVGKTYVAKRYVDWASAGRLEESRMQGILDSLPANQRQPWNLADEVVQRGLSCLWDIVQFHPGYDYTDFVRTLAAVPHGDGVTFVAQHRILSQMAAIGRELESRNYDLELVLILDEINRGDIPNIFGELLYGLEYRGEAVATPYSIDGDASLAIPANLRLLGTMNTADRSIAVIDYALRRRFVFLEVPGGEAPIRSCEFDTDVARDAALYLYRATAETLKEAPAGLQVGPSYFLAAPGASETGLEVLASRYVYEVLPLLSEYGLEGEVRLEAIGDLRSQLGIDSSPSQRAQFQALLNHLNSSPWAQQDAEQQ